MGFDLSSISSLTKNLTSTVSTIKSVPSSISSITKMAGLSSVSNVGSASNKAQSGYIAGSITDLSGIGALNGYGVSNTSPAVKVADGTTSSAGGPQIQTQSTGAETGAFKWVEQFITPDMFATPESCLIGYGAPVKSSNAAGSNFKLIGFCQNLTINTGVNVVTFKELRNERTIVIPTKSQAGSISITRMLGSMPDFAATVVGGKGWKMDSHSIDVKQLFGLVIIYMTAGRKSTISTMYAERCAIQSMSIPIQAGQFELLQNINIVFDRLVDGTTTVTQVGGEKASSPSSPAQAQPNTSMTGLNDAGIIGLGGVGGSASLLNGNTGSASLLNGDTGSASLLNGTGNGIDMLNLASKDTASKIKSDTDNAKQESLGGAAYDQALKATLETRRANELYAEKERIAGYANSDAEVKLQLTLDSNARLNKKYPTLTPLTERGVNAEGYVLVGSA